MSEAVEKITTENETVATETTESAPVTEVTETITTEAATGTEEAKNEATTKDDVVEGEAAAEPAAEAATEEAAAVVVEEEIEEIESGLLQKKSKPFGIWPDRYFYFTDEAFELPKLKAVYKKHASSIVPKSKDKDDHEIFRGIAHATHTGKGLLFYTSNSKNIAEPHGIIVLSQVTNIQYVSAAKPAHQLKLTTNHHTWELGASSEKELKRWEKTIQRKVEEAKTLAVEETETYKATFEKLRMYYFISPMLVGYLGKEKKKNSGLGWNFSVLLGCTGGIRDISNAFYCICIVFRNGPHSL